MNSIVIEQSPDHMALAQQVHQNASIERIRMVRAKAAAPSVETHGQLDVNFNVKSKLVTAPPGMLRLQIGFRMAGVREAEPEPAVLVECAYEVDYLLREGFQVTPEQVKAFKDGNGIFNAWPYFREYLQNSLVRMGLPPLAAPFLRLQAKATS
jgi:hypothetical protein